MRFQVKSFTIQVVHTHHFEYYFQYFPNTFIFFNFCVNRSYDDNTKQVIIRL